MKSVVRILVLLSAFFSSNLGLANLLIFQSSDNHSEYANIPNYIRSTSALAQDFDSHFPGHPIIHLANGDFAGPSTVTLLHGGDDKGFLNYQVFAALHQRYFTVLNSGNHDYDYRGEFGINLYLHQNREFLRLANQRATYSWAPGAIKITTANIKPTALSQSLIQPYQQLHTPTGKKVRVVGLVLDDYFAYSVYDQTLSNQTIAEIIPMLDAAKEQILKAASENVDAVIFMVHEQFSIVKSFLHALKLWKSEAEKTNPQLAHIKIPVTFAGHDHKSLYEEFEGTHIIDSGTAYSYSAVELNDDAEFVARKFWSVEDQKQYESFSALYKEESDALNSVYEYLVEANANAEQVVIDAQGQALMTTGFETIRANMQKGHQELGSLVVDTFVHWTKEELQTQGLLQGVSGVLGFYNSGTYRAAKPVPAGPITRLMSIMPYPNPGSARILILKGEEVQKMYSALRKFGDSKNDFTPQIASNMREAIHTKTPYALEIQDNQGQWDSIDLDAEYALVLDVWLGMNGFKIAEFEEAFNKSREVHPKSSAEMIEILSQYYPGTLNLHFKHCEALLSSKSTPVIEE